MSVEQIALIGFIIGMVAFIAKSTIDHLRERLEESLFRLLRTIGDSAKIGEAPESSIKRISEMKNEPASKIFKQILILMNEGNGFSESLNMVSKKFHLQSLTSTAKILIASKESNSNEFEILNNYSQHLWKLKHLGRYAKESTQSNPFVIKVMVAVILPGLFYFLPSIIEGIFVPSYSYYVFAAYGLIASFYDLLMYNEMVMTLTKVPILISLPILIPKIMEMFFK